jgi:hypothetical protein
MNFKIKDILGPRCIIKDDGQKIYNVIHPLLMNGEDVILDFEGITQFASPFFNFAVGQLLKDIKREDIECRLKVQNMSDAGKQLLELVIENAAKYHGNPDYRKIVDDILKQQEQDSN